MTLFLTKEEVIAAHYYMMRQMNDVDQAGIKDHTLLDSAIRRPMQSLFGEDAYPSLFDKAGALLESLVKNHYFHNGNKRTAYLVVKSFLMINGYHLRMERVFAVEFIVDIAKGNTSFEQIVAILYRHSVSK
ncbi:death-on-curing protein [Paenibacillus sp. SORGH_AS306]|uniref:type II toxin-antitoxin system death-on-curing family toxin n=1 Tax=unclassified Paenibacillus TaxID=185978 RepID=UPI0027857039|nr:MULTISPECIES: type II toxin-antitoxin system death-on-curing family toxin [unclassified Paenibacillus]MDQ1236719.1 death-on-curing protein [Paenibacillus sp. SORGH_AS_0306]MDR6109076.1 death-on-curing protein [Paenibacillus sp. SORGH_AS_0338]